MAAEKVSWSAAFSGVCDNTEEAANAFEALFDEFVRKARELPGADTSIDGNGNGQFYGSGFPRAERYLNERNVKASTTKKPGG